MILKLVWYCKLTQAGNSYIFIMHSINKSHIKMVCAGKHHGCRKTLNVAPVPPLRYLIYCRLLSYWARVHRATPNKRVALSPAAKVPITFRADKSYQDCGVSVKSGREVVRVFSQASIIKALVIFYT